MSLLCYWLALVPGFCDAFVPDTSNSLLSPGLVISTKKITWNYLTLFYYLSVRKHMLVCQLARNKPKNNNREQANSKVWFQQTCKGGTIPEITKSLSTYLSCHNFFSLSSVQIFLIPACCLLCVL